MVDLRDQLGALLSLEVKYATRDYLMDIATSQHEHCDESTTAYKDTPSRDYHEDEKTDDTSQSLSRSTTPTNNALITEQHAMDWREKICEWSYQVADHFDLTRDLVYITLNYVDRVCAASSNAMELLRDKNRFKLLAMAALCLAIKIHGEVDTHIPGVESSIIDTILHMGRGSFTAEQLKTMEVYALQRLQWLLHPPTPQVFISYLFELYLHSEEYIELKEIALYIVELSVHDYYFVLSKPSVVALAALSNAARMLGCTELWIINLQEDLRLRHSDYEETNKIDACKARLEKLYANTGAKLEDFVDIPSPIKINIDNNLDEVCRDLSPLTVVMNQETQHAE